MLRETFIPATDFGLVPDGRKGATAIQTALDAAEARGGGTVYLPPGQVELDVPLYVAPDVRLLGAGAEATDVVSTASEAIIRPRYEDRRNQNIGISDLKLYSEDAAIGIDFRLVGRSQIDRVKITGVKSGGTGIALGGDITQKQRDEQGVLCWLNRIRDVRISDAKVCVLFDGEDSDGVGTANGILIDACELIPTVTNASYGVRILHGDGNWITHSDIGYADLACGVEFGAGSLLNTAAFNRFEGVATAASGTPRSALEVLSGADKNAVLYNNFSDSVKRPYVADAGDRTMIVHLDGAAHSFGDFSSTATINVTSNAPEVLFAWMDRNVTIQNPTAGVFPIGKRFTFVFEQDDAGSRTVTWGSDWKVRGTVASAANARSAFTFVYCGTGPKWVEV